MKSWDKIEKKIERILYASIIESNLFNTQYNNYPLKIVRIYILMSDDNI